MAVGIMKMSSTDMYALLCTACCPSSLRASRLNEVPTILLACSREKNKGIGIETVHVLNDNFWKLGDFV